jgi:hypothetical protein
VKVKERKHAAAQASREDAEDDPSPLPLPRELRQGRVNRRLGIVADDQRQGHQLKDQARDKVRAGPA